MSQPFRIAPGNGIDRTEPLRFSFDGRRLEGYAGDTLASALLANGVRLIARSFKYHRPRGIVGIGAEEPTALVTVGEGANVEPNTRATMTELHEGLVAASQNCWPSAGFDLGAINDVMYRLLPAGFYYKTFMWPASFWMAYEHFIRRMAGMGRAPAASDPDRYETMRAEFDVLVIGAGPAGLSAARGAARSGARVLIADENAATGGCLLGGPETIADAPAANWLRATLHELESLRNVTLLRRSTVFGHYDHGLFGIVERVADHVAPSQRAGVRQRLWKVYAKQTVFATGAIERHLVFPNNDRPGIMLASAVRGYLHRYGVACGRSAIIATNNDSAYPLAAELKRAGVAVAAVVDARPEVQSCAAELRAAGVRHLAGHVIDRVAGRGAVKSVDVVPVSGGSGEILAADLVCVSGGWTPAVHLHSQAKGRLRFDDDLGAPVPDGAIAATRSAGGCRGILDLDDCVADGFEAGSAVAADLGFAKRQGAAPQRAVGRRDFRVGSVIHRGSRGGRCFVDLQNDVVVSDIELAVREGYGSVEHVKRYTTLGMGTDQGKIGNLSGLTAMSQALERSVAEVGVTTFRPPYNPVTIGALVGRELIRFAHPVRRTAAHDWHLEKGAVMMNAGLWQRPLNYISAGETAQEAVNRQVDAVRTNVGVVDVSTLGKIEIIGPDAAELLDRLYTNGWKKLAVGRGRYGLMLREDGFVFDDGVTMRLADNHFLMTTTTANADAVVEWIEFYLQTHWPELKAYAVPVTEQWFAAALAGRKSRAVLAKLMPDLDVGDAAFPLMAIREGAIAGAPARVMRISFSGELSYEINVPADYGLWLWKQVLAAGAEFGIMPYGIDAVGALRIEKGHVVVGAEADGRTTPDDLGLGALVSAAKDFIGKRSLALPGLQGADRKQLVGLVVDDPKEVFPVGAQVVATRHREPEPSIGHVTSYAYSTTLGRQVALALLKGGRARLGQKLFAVSPTAGAAVAVTVTESCFVDPEGERLRA